MTSRAAKRWGFLVAAALACPILVADAAPASGASPDGGSSAHWLLTVRVGPSGTEILDARKLPWAMKAPRGSPRHPRRTWWVSIEDAEGREIRGMAIAAPDELRGEFHSDGGIDAHHFRLSSATFSLRLPDLPNAAMVRLWAESTLVPPGDPRLSSARSGRVELGQLAYPR